MEKSFLKEGKHYVFTLNEGAIDVKVIRQEGDWVSVLLGEKMDSYWVNTGLVEAIHEISTKQFLVRTKRVAEESKKSSEQMAGVAKTLDSIIERLKKDRKQKEAANKQK